MIKNMTFGQMSAFWLSKTVKKDNQKQHHKYLPAHTALFTSNFLEP